MGELETTTIIGIGGFAIAFGAVAQLTHFRTMGAMFQQWTRRTSSFSPAVLSILANLRRRRAWQWFSNFLLEAFVSRVSRRIDIGKVQQLFDELR